MNELLKQILENERIDKSEICIMCNNYIIYMKDNIFCCSMPGYHGIETDSIEEVIKTIGR